MIRESTDAGSTFAAVYLTGDYGVRFQGPCGYRRQCHQRQ